MTSSNEYLLVSNCGDFFKITGTVFFSRNRSSLPIIDDCMTVLFKCDLQQ